MSKKKSPVFSCPFMKYYKALGPRDRSDGQNVRRSKNTKHAMKLPMDFNVFIFISVESLLNKLQMLSALVLCGCEEKKQFDVCL